jgi:predicted MFS family arabinose efflux permease
MVSIFGSLITATAFPFIAINLLDAGPVQMAMLGLASILPSALLGSLAGVWIDRRPAKLVMIGSDLVSAAALFAVPIAWWTDRLSLWLLLTVALVTNLARLTFRVADRSFLPRVVGKDQIESANATLSGGSALAEAGGFSLGGLLIQIFSGPFALLIDGVSFLGSAFLLRKIDVETEIENAEEGEPDLHWRTALADGLRYLRNSPILSPLAISLFLMSAGMQMIGTVYFLFVNKELGFGPGVLGVVFAVGGIGSLLGATFATRATATFGAGIALIGSLVVMGSVMGMITIASTAGLFALIIMIAQQLGDGFWIYYESTGTSLRQVQAPESMLGRINGAFENIEFIGLLIGAGLGALVGEFVGIRATILTGAALVILAALPLAISPVRHVRTLTAPQPESALDPALP